MPGKAKISCFWPLFWCFSQGVENGVFRGVFGPLCLFVIFGGFYVFLLISTISVNFLYFIILTTIPTNSITCHLLFNSKFIYIPSASLIYYIMLTPFLKFNLFTLDSIYLPTQLTVSTKFKITYYNLKFKSK